MSDLIPLEEVRASVLALVRPAPAVTVPLANLVGRVLVSDVVAPDDVPGFANSGMDGYAVVGADVQVGGARLRVVGEVLAGGSTSTTVETGTAVKIMTGAPMPPGADTVVKVEDTMTDGPFVVVGPPVDRGTAVRPAGGDIRGGSTVLESGTRIDVSALGVLATVGVEEIAVSAPPRVAVFSTGDELVEPGSGSLTRGQIFDANRRMLLGLVREAGGEPVDMGIVPDDTTQLRKELENVGEVDVIITSGGVSMGDRDVTKQLLLDTGEVDFVTIAMQPGKPFGFGMYQGALFFGLPGNPVSVVVSFEQLVRPALLSMQGARRIRRPLFPVVAGEEWTTDPNKTVFLRVAVQPDASRLVARRSGAQASNVLSALAAADGFAVVPVGVATVSPGDAIEVEMFRMERR